jgi:cation transport regulator ChaB
MANTKKKTKRNTATSREIARLKATIYKVAWQAFKEEDINRLRTSLYKVAWQAFKEESK